MTIQLSTLFLILSLSIDSLFAAYSYGTNKIRVTLLNMIIFAFVSSLIYTISLLCSFSILAFFDIKNLQILGSLILMGLGISKLIDPFIKRLIKKHPSKRNFGIKTSNFKIIINIYAEPIEADINKSKTLSIKETLLLSIAMNIDTLLAGLMIDSALNSWYIVSVIAFVINFLLLLLGYFIGQKIGSKDDKDFSFIGGFLLIILGINVLF